MWAFQISFQYSVKVYTGASNQKPEKEGMQKIIITLCHTTAYLENEPAEVNDTQAKTICLEWSALWYGRTNTKGRGSRVANVFKSCSNFAIKMTCEDEARYES